MSIKLNDKLITLSTENTSYQMKIDELGYLFHTWYGKKIEGADDMSYRISSIDRGFSGNPYETMDRTYSLDVFPQEYPTFGNGDYRADCIQVVHPDGSNVLDLKYDSCEITRGKYQLKGLPGFTWSEDEGESIQVNLIDKESGIRVELLYGVLEKYDIITRSVRVVNTSQNTLKVEKALSACIDMVDGDFDLIHFHGKHAMEREFERSPLAHGKLRLESKRGTSSHQQNPFVILAKKGTNEVSGECIGAAFVYSGSFIIEAEVDQVNQTRLVVGLHPEQFEYILNAGEELVLPEVAFTYSDAGFEKLTHSYHDAVRANLQRGKFVHTHRPILINNWEATYFDFDADKLFDIASKAKSLGIEMLVMDDGWFGERYDDTKGLGDWYVNEKKLGSSLKELADRINAIDMKLGIWFEPEMINEDTNLYREHPDFMIRVPGRKGVKGREQYVLDFTRKDVRDYIKAMVVNILKNANISYVKWDMNRSLAAVYSAKLDANSMGEFHYRYVLGLYELLDELTTEFPDVLFEGCSGGGGRYDLGMLYYHPQIWLSDDTDPIERLKIQYGSSFAYPIGSAGAHVSASPNHQTMRRTPFETRATVAMAGTFGYELDLNKISDKEQEMVKSQVRDYLKYDELVHEGDYYRLTSPYDSNRVCAWQTVSKDKSFGLLSAVVQSLEANESNIYVYPRGLDETAVYEIAGAKRTGRVWMNGGFLIPRIREEYESFRFEIKKV